MPFLRDNKEAEKKRNNIGLLDCHTNTKPGLEICLNLGKVTNLIQGIPN